jgi:hypothetical protein
MIHEFLGVHSLLLRFLQVNQTCCLLELPHVPVPSGPALPDPRTYLPATGEPPPGCGLRPACARGTWMLIGSARPDAPESVRTRAADAPESVRTRELERLLERDEPPPERDELVESRRRDWAARGSTPGTFAMRAKSARTAGALVSWGGRRGDDGRDGLSTMETTPLSVLEVGDGEAGDAPPEGAEAVTNSRCEFAAANRCVSERGRSPSASLLAMSFWMVYSRVLSGVTL